MLSAGAYFLGGTMDAADVPRLHICHAPEDDDWVHGRMIPGLGLQHGQYRTRSDDALGELQLRAIERAVYESRFTILVASSAARWNKLVQFAAEMARYAGIESAEPRLIVIGRDFAPGSEAERTRLSLAQRALVGLDCSSEASTATSLARLRDLLSLGAPIDVPPPCPYPGLAPFTVDNRKLLFGRNADRDALLRRIREEHSRILVVGPSGSGKSSLIHAAVLPELAHDNYVVQTVPRGRPLASALRDTIDALGVAALGRTLDEYVAAARGATDMQIAQARDRLRATVVHDGRRRAVVVDPLEEIFAEDDPTARETLFALLGGLWSLSWCTVILCMRADFYGEVMIERCWRELEASQYPVAPLDEAGLRAAIVEPARSVGVHVDAALVERLLREVDRDRSSVPLPLLQVALKHLWAHLRWRHLTLADYELIVNNDQRGLAAVLAVHAEAVLQRLAGPGDRAVAQRILLDLVHLGEGRPHTRRRRSLDDLRRSGDAPEQVERIVEKLVAGRLLVVSDGDGSSSHDEDIPTSQAQVGQVDLAHDTLITGWPALAGWILEHRDQLRTQRHLEGRAATGSVLSGDELPEFIRWIQWTETPAGQLLGASDSMRALVRRSLATRRLRRGMLGLGLIAAMAIAIIFGFQARQLREEKTKTQRSISKAASTANMIVYELDKQLRTVACTGASAARNALLKRSRELLGELGALGALGTDVKRTRMVGWTAQADLAMEQGHLEVARSLYQEVLGDAQKRAAEDPTNIVWQSDLAISYNNLGEVALATGKLGDAQAWFDKGLAVATAVAAVDLKDPASQRDLSISYNHLGEVAVAAGRLQDAVAWFNRALAARHALIVVHPDSDLLRHDLSVSYDKLGESAASAGRLQDAHTWFDKALAVRIALVAADPGNALWQRDLSLSYHERGNVAVLSGRLDDARTWLDKSVAISSMLSTADPTNIGWKRDLMVSYSALGDVAPAGGRLNDAHAQFDKALAIAIALTITDPTNTRWQRDLAVCYGRLGDVAAAAGKLEDARAWFDKTLAIANELAGSDPANAQWRHDVALSYERLGDIALSDGRLDDARAWFEKALTIARSLLAVDATDTEWRRDIGVDYEKLGEVAVAADTLAKARAWFEAAVAIGRSLIAIDPGNVGWQRELSIYYEQLGKVAVTAGRLDDARRWFDSALEVANTLTAADPTNVSAQRDLAAYRDRLGHLAMSVGRLDEARAWFEDALATTMSLTTRDPTNVARQRGLSISHRSLGEVAMSEGKLGDARAWFSKALAISDSPLTVNPSDAGPRDDLLTYVLLSELAEEEQSEDEIRQVPGRQPLAQRPGQQVGPLG